MNYLIFAVVAIFPALVLIIRKKFFFTLPKTIEYRHIVITGGSSGIGRSLAILSARRGANVTIIARNRHKLQEAKLEIQRNRLRDSQKIKAISVDVTNYKKIEQCFNDIDDEDQIYMLVNCAGFSISGKLEDIPMEYVKNMMDINFYGTYNPIRAVITKLKTRKKGIIVICGSQASLFGFYGYSAYASSKFALRGLAEVLDMEVRQFNVSVTLALPPDTDMPGFESENTTIPEDKKVVRDVYGLYTPKRVAENILKDALDRKFFSYIGASSFLLVNLCSGMSPATCVEVLYQSLLMGLLKVIGFYYLKCFHNVPKKVSF